MEEQELKEYEVTVQVTFSYIVEASSKEEAEEEGWNWEEYKQFMSVDSIKVDEIERYEDEEETDEEDV